MTWEKHCACTVDIDTLHCGPHCRRHRSTQGRCFFSVLVKKKLWGMALQLDPLALGLTPQRDPF